MSCRNPLNLAEGHTRRRPHSLCDEYPLHHIHLSPPSSPTSLPIKRQHPARRRSNESLIPQRSSLRQPPDAPKTLVALRLRGDTLPALQTPHLDLAVVGAAEQELAAPVPVDAHDPAAVARQVRHMLTALRVVERDDARVAGRREVFVRGAEAHRADGFDQPRERVCEPPRRVVEEVQGAVLVARGGEVAVGGDVDREGEGAFRFVGG